MWCCKKREKPIKVFIYTPWLTRKVYDLFNFIICFGVIIPAAYFLKYQLNTCPHKINTTKPTNLNSGADTEYHLAYRWLYTLTRRQDVFFQSPNMMERAACEIFMLHKTLWVHLMFFAFVDIGFYLIYLLQNSTWLIDPHWQLLPMCISIFYFLHPSATLVVDGENSHHPRAILTLGLLLLWAFRLLHNYFRRENWHFGEREDWRYAEMRKNHGIFFTVSQFFVVNLAQHGMLVGLTLPLSRAMESSGSELNWIDCVAFLFCSAGIVIGFFADNQLHAYMNMKNKPLLLETGLWKYSRHPNHFGEQIWWVGLLLFGVAASAESNNGIFSITTWWPIAFGVCFNHPLDTFVTLKLIEDRMLRRPERAEIYKKYQERTSLILPLPQGESKEKKM
jgi:steroid 5-alpha reductase family enzyme